MTLNLLRLDKAGDQKRYKELVAGFAFKTPYLSLEFFSIFSGGLDQCVCFHYKNGNHEILLPGYLKSIPPYHELKDFSSPYGYSGPFYNIESAKTETCEFWNVLDKWYKENNIVSEFIRFSLDDNYLGYSGILCDTLSNIKGCILDVEAQWSSFDRKVRKNVNKAKAEKLVSKIYWGHEVEESSIESFYNIYIKTMERTKAANKFFYTLDQFKTFTNRNDQLCAFALIFDEQVCISAEMLLVSENSIYSFLGGTDEFYFDKRPNDFLKFNVINWARQWGLKYFILGGGYGADDGIYKYKKAFFPNDVIIFKTGRKVIDDDVYYKLIANFITVSENEQMKFFPLYRYKL